MWRDRKCSLNHNLSNEICPEYVAPISASYFSYFLASCHNFNTVSFLVLRGLNKQGYKCRRKLFLFDFIFFLSQSILFSQLLQYLVIYFPQNATQQSTRDASKKSLADAPEQQRTAETQWWAKFMLSSMNVKVTPCNTDLTPTLSCILFYTTVLCYSTLAIVQWFCIFCFIILWLMQRTT